MKFVKVFILLVLVAATLSKVKRNKHHRRHHRSHSGEITAVNDIPNLSFSLKSSNSAQIRLKSLGKISGSKSLCLGFDEFNLLPSQKVISGLHEICKYDEKTHFFCIDDSKFDLHYKCKGDHDKNNQRLKVHVIDRSNKAEKANFEFAYSNKVDERNKKNNFFNLINSLLADDKEKCGDKDI